MTRPTGEILAHVIATALCVLGTVLMGTAGVVWAIGRWGR